MREMVPIDLGGAEGPLPEKAAAPQLTMHLADGSVLRVTPFYARHVARDGTEMEVLTPAASVAAICRRGTRTA